MRSAGHFSQQSSFIWATPLQDVLGSHGDPDVLEYVAGSLEDGDFDYGNNGQEAYEAFAGVLVRSLTYQAILLLLLRYERHAGTGLPER